jgi:hypothetical protein
MESVEVFELGKTSILTLMLKQILDRNLQDPRKSGVMKGRVLTVHVRARQMRTTLFFEANRVRAEDGAHGRPDIEIVGDMSVLLSISLGASPVRAVLARRMRVRPMGWKGLAYGLRLKLMMQLAGPPICLRLLARRGREKGESP